MVGWRIRVVMAVLCLVCPSCGQESGSHRVVIRIRHAQARVVSLPLTLASQVSFRIPSVSFSPSTAEEQKVTIASVSRSGSATLHHEIGRPEHPPAVPSFPIPKSIAFLVLTVTEKE